MNLVEHIRSLLERYLPGYQEHLPDWVLIGATLLLALVTLLLVAVTGTEVLLKLRERREHSRAKRAGVSVQSVKSFNPGQIVGAYTAGTTAYLSIASDPELKSILEAGQDLLIVGRPGIGKSHAAITHIKQTFPKWSIVRPGRNSVPKLLELAFKARKYVLLLDDLDEYASDSEGMANVLDAVAHIRGAAKRLVVVATIRSTIPEFDALATIPKLFGRWRVVDLEDWPLTKAQALAELTGSSLEFWDGTPLSVKQPSSEMRIRYEQASLEQRQVLSLIKTLHAYGVRPIRLQLLERLTNRDSGPAPDVPVHVAVNLLRQAGFLKGGEASIEAYDPYLETVPFDSLMDNAEPLIDVLRELRLVSELVRVASHFADQQVFARATDILGHAVALEPLQERLHYRLGIVFARQGRLSDAVDEFARATTLSPGWASAWFRMGTALTKQGRKKKAAEAFAKAKVASRLDSPARRCLRIASLREAGQLDVALREIDDVVATAPELSLAWFEKGRVLSDAKRFSDAVPAFREALRIDPTMAEAHFGLARPLFEAGNMADCEEAYRRAARLSPKLAEPHSFLAKLLMESGRLDEAEEEIQAAIALKPSNPEFHSYHGQILSRCRKPVEMERAFREALRLRPEYVEALIGLAAALRIQKRIDEAIETNQRAIGLDPRQSSAHLGLGMCLIDKRNFPNAVEHLRQAVVLDDKIAAAHFYLGRTLIALGELEEAIAELRKAEERRYNRGKVQWQLAKAFASTGYTDDAMAALRAASASGFALDGGRLANDRTFRVLRSHPQWASFVSELPRQKARSTGDRAQEA